MSSSEHLKAAAHEYRARSWRVIQLHGVGPDGTTCSCKRGAKCASKGKHPRDEKWQNTEPYSAPDIEALWEERPNANIGLATGRPSGFWVLDIDPDSGGGETMGALVAEHGSLPTTFTVRTGSGGWHYYFAMPEGEDVTNSQGRVGKGVDVRGTGGQVVAAPSRTDKGDYRPCGSDTLAPAPEWLVELVRKPEPTTPEVTAAELPKPEDLSESEWKRLNAYADRAINAELERLRRLQQTGWDGEPWNATTFEVACTLLEFANSPWCSYTTWRLDVIECSPRDDQGFDGEAVATILQSAQATVGDKARAVPPNRDEDEDLLFDNPAVRHLGTPPSDPSEPPKRTRRDLFGGDKGTTPLTANMAAEVLEDGPLAWGRDEIFWSYAPKGVWVPDRDVVVGRMVDMLGNAFRTSHVGNTTPIVKHRVPRLNGAPVEQMMNFANGMLDWRTGKLLEHDPAYKSTIQFPYFWDPEATCPKFEEFLAEVLLPDYIDLAWQMLGYLLLSGNPMQVAFLFYGQGGNGKGTLMRVIQDMLGEDNVANESLDQLNQSTFSAVNLYGKIANLAGDIDGSYQESTANFKKLTGEDHIGAERKYGDRFRFVSWAVPVFSANSIPGSADVTEGYLRRWIILHFHKKIAAGERRIHLSDELSREIPGIAAKAVAALRPLMERQAFDIAGEALKGKEMFAKHIDQVRQWLDSGDVLVNTESVTQLVLLHGAYRGWAERSSQGRLGLREFEDRLQGIGYAPQHIAGEVYYKGLAVSPISGHHTKSDVDEPISNFGL